MIATIVSLAATWLLLAFVVWVEMRCRKADAVQLTRCESNSLIPTKEVIS